MVLLLAQEMPTERGHFARRCNGGDLVAAAGPDAWEEKSRKGPGALEAAQAASTSMARAWARPCLVIRPCCAGPSPDWRTEGLRPKELTSFWGEENRSIVPTADLIPTATAMVIPATLKGRRQSSSFRAKRLLGQPGTARLTEEIGARKTRDEIAVEDRLDTAET